MQKKVNQPLVVGVFGLLLGLFWLIPVTVSGQTSGQIIVQTEAELGEINKTLLDAVNTNDARTKK